MESLFAALHRLIPYRSITMTMTPLRQRMLEDMGIRNFRDLDLGPQRGPISGN
jgi:hypothetical protein